MNSSNLQLVGSLRGKVAVVTGASRGAGWEQAGIDLLVNNCWGGYEQHDYRKFSAPFHERSGKVLAVGDLAAEHGFTDVDGRHIAAFKMPDQE